MRNEIEEIIMAAPAQTSMLHIRVDDKTKIQAAQTLAAIGMSMSDAVRLFLHRVVADQAFPIELKVPNATTRTAMIEARAKMAAGSARFATAEALFDDLEKNRRK
jgi:DNA-damage-inducible protein J